jgi:prepilin-type N-terminal cleavage/methylation domain-containing protein
MLVFGHGRRSINIEGFTLIEVLVVIVILLTVLTIGISNFTKYIHNSNLKTAGRDLAGDIYNCKQGAAAQSVVYKIKFNKDNNNYTIFKDGSATAIKNFGSVADYIRMDSASFGYDQIVFQPRGTTTGGNVILVNDMGSKIMVVTSLMGKVSVKYN